MITNDNDFFLDLDPMQKLLPLFITEKNSELYSWLLVLKENLNSNIGI